MKFLFRFGFAKAEWDGFELTCYGVDGYSFGCRSFIPGSATRRAWDALEDKLCDKEINEREFQQPTPDVV